MFIWYALDGGELYAVVKNNRLVGKHRKGFSAPPNLFKGGEKLSIDDFNGGGKPLDDKRLTLSGTTEAGQQQYRMWHDSQQILVPRGQSITKPLMPENVQANVGVFGSIKKGYFQSPVVEFRNTIDYKLFDRFNMSTYRDYFPDDPDTELDTLGFYLIDLNFTLVVEWYTFAWEIPKNITLIKIDKNIFQTPNAHLITTYTPYDAQGGQEYNVEFSCFFNIGLSENFDLGILPFGNHILSLGLQNCKINRGSSEYLYNPTFNPSLPKIKFSAKNIKPLRGWG